MYESLYRSVRINEGKSSVYFSLRAVLMSTNKLSMILDPPHVLVGVQAPRVQCVVGERHARIVSFAIRHQEKCRGHRVGPTCLI